MKKVAIIGSGIGGLAAAIRLAARGAEVDVFEKEAYPGGKLSELRSNGFRFDLGPSLFTQPERVLELFSLMGEDPADHFHYRPLDTVCRYFWPDGTRLAVPSDPEKFARESAAVMKTDAEGISAYLARSGELYRRAAPLFLDQPFPTRKAFLSPEGQQIGRNPLVLDPFVSLHKRNRRSFSDPRIVQLFDRYATYNGSNPYKAPATLKMIAHLEHSLGAFFPDGGMYQISAELAGLALRHGVKIHYRSPVEKVNLDPNDGSVAGIRSGGRNLEYGTVVSDVDINTFYRTGMISARRPFAGRGQTLSTSALIFYWGVSGSFPELDLHNILFSRGYKEEFRDLFDRKRIGHDPTVYIFISSRMVPDDAPSGHENWFVMVNAPENIGQDWPRMIASVKQDILEKIRRMTGIRLADRIVFEHVEDPSSIESRTGSWHGSLYGNSSNSRMSAFSRHPNHRSKIKGLYFTGGSVHPGGGIPLCLASAKIVSKLIDEGESYG